DSEKTTARTLAGQQKEKKSSSLYAHNAAPLLARLAVEEGKLDQAVTALRWVLQNKPDITTEQVTRLRLARLLIAKQDYTEVESFLANPVNAFKIDYAEARVDLAGSRGDLAAAKNAFEEALTGVDPQVQERRILLQDRKSVVQGTPV